MAQLLFRVAPIVEDVFQGRAAKPQKINLDIPKQPGCRIEPDDRGQEKVLARVEAGNRIGLDAREPPLPRAWIKVG